MLRSRLTSLLLVPLAALAACGGASDDRPSAAAPAPEPRADLELAATDGRVGDATAAGRDGLDLLSTGGRIDADRVRPPRERDGVAAGDACPDTELRPSVETLPAIEAATLCLINAERAAAGLPALTADDRLAAAAARHAQAMVADQFFAHRGLGGDSSVDRIRATGYIPRRGAWIVGENLAWGTGTLATPRAIVAAWMNSAGHRENILRDRFRQLGQGIILGNPRSPDGAGATFAMTFGTVERPTTAPVSRTPSEGSRRRTRSSRSRSHRKSSRTTRAARRAAARRAPARRAQARRARARRARARDARARRAVPRRAVAQRSRAPR